MFIYMYAIYILCIYVYIYLCVYICIYICIYIYTNSVVHLCAVKSVYELLLVGALDSQHQVCVSVCESVGRVGLGGCLCVCVCVCVCLSVCVYACVCMCVYIYIYIYIYIHTHTHTLIVNTDTCRGGARGMHAPLMHEPSRATHPSALQFSASASSVTCSWSPKLNET
jgi:hypothetical protein